MYGVPKDLLGLLEGRQTYVIGKDGTVKLVYNNQFQARGPGCPPQHSCAGACHLHLQLKSRLCRLEVRASARH